MAPFAVYIRFLSTFCAFSLFHDLLRITTKNRFDAKKAAAPVLVLQLS
jgi:hypothetical protein